jgi:type IV pilus assembly protein PilE
MLTSNLRIDRSQQGFTLIELMLVTVIIAILAAIAIPSYGTYVTKTKRRAMQSQMLRVADQQEQFFLDNKVYADDLSELGYAGATVGIDNSGEVVAADASGLTYQLISTRTENTHFFLTATPQGSQAEQDSDCAKLFINKAGRKEVSGAADNCW